MQCLIVAGRAGYIYSRVIRGSRGAIKKRKALPSEQPIIKMENLRARAQPCVCVVVVGETTLVTLDLAAGDIITCSVAKLFTVPRSVL